MKNDYIVLFQLPWASENLIHVPTLEFGRSCSKGGRLGLAGGWALEPHATTSSLVALCINQQTTFYWATKSTVMIAKHYNYALSIP